MVKDTVGILNLPQREINRQLYEMLIKAESGDAAAIKAVVDEIGDETTAGTILKRLKDNETAIESLQDAIGDESTANSILGRIKDLEDAS